MKKSYRSSCLFHYTTYNSLFSILEQGIVPNFCREVNVFSEIEDDYVGIPQISFCDIPLSMTGVFTARYKNHAIGFSQDWGRRNLVAPILYSLPNTIPYKNMPIEALAYIKPFYGKTRGGVLQSNYEENEWRFVVPRTTHDWLLSSKDYTNWRGSEKNKPRADAILVSQALRFTIADIKYIIVEQDNQLAKSIVKIRKLNQLCGLGNRLLEAEKDKLISKLISMERIKRDF